MPSCLALGPELVHERDEGSRRGDRTARRELVGTDNIRLRRCPEAVRNHLMIADDVMRACGPQPGPDSRHSAVGWLRVARCGGRI